MSNITESSTARSTATDVEKNSKTLDHKAQTLPFADAPNIVRAHQKDSYLESVLRGKLQETVQLFTGQRFIHTHPEELTVLSKALYLSLTTLLGSRTLGEEYTDLIYVNRRGNRLPKLIQRLGFILSYAILPYFIMRFIKRQIPKEGEDDDKNAPIKSGWKRLLKNVSYSKVLDTLMSLHLGLFYLKGSYYNLSKRIFGMRYAFGHKVDKQSEISNGGYELLGGLIFAQWIFKSIKAINEALRKSPDSDDNNSNVDDDTLLEGKHQGKRNSRIVQFTGIPPQSKQIDLSDPGKLRYIPENSRKCMLCLSYMVDPSCAPCGHIFCWSCISDWSREHPECPLCRQGLSEQELLPLR